MDLFADPNLILQVGDRVMVVGQQDAVERVAGVLGNQLKRLDTPNIVTIFVGIFLGILLGSLPIAFPGMPTPLIRFGRRTAGSGYSYRPFRS